MKLLLHVCCANCAIYPVKVLRQQCQQVTGLFFNPNIHPYQEYQRRLEATRSFAAGAELPMLWRDDYLLEEFLMHVAGNPSSRCDYCYHSRLEETAKTAVANGFTAFSTTLLYSRFQQHDTIREFGMALAGRYGLVFHYEDYRTGWKEGIETSKSLGLYRQQYCGCIYSEKDRYHPRSSN